MLFEIQEFLNKYRSFESISRNLEVMLVEK